MGDFKGFHHQKYRGDRVHPCPTRSQGLWPSSLGKTQSLQSPLSKRRTRCNRQIGFEILASFYENSRCKYRHEMSGNTVESCEIILNQYGNTRGNDWTYDINLTSGWLSCCPLQLVLLCSTPWVELRRVVAVAPSTWRRWRSVAASSDAGETHRQ